MITLSYLFAIQWQDRVIDKSLFLLKHRSEEIGPKISNFQVYSISHKRCRLVQTHVFRYSHSRAC